MMIVKFNKFALLVALLISSNAFSQNNFYFGYNFSTFTSAQRYFQVIDYQYQKTYGYTEKGFGLSPLLHGISYGVHFQLKDAFGMTINRSRKSVQSNVAEFPNDKLSQYKMNVKTWGVGYTFLEDFPKIGIDFEFGRMVLKKKEYVSTEFKNGKWVDYCPTVQILGKGPTFMGMTIYSMHRLKFLEIRPYFSWMPGVVEYPDYSSGASYYTFRISTVGINIYYVFGEK